MDDLISALVLFLAMRFSFFTVFFILCWFLVRVKKLPCSLL